MEVIVAKGDTNSRSSLLGSPHGGITSLTACLFVVGEMTGAALLAMPQAIKSTGLYLGPFLMILTCIASAYGGVILSKCWLLLESADSSLNQITTRDPFALIGERACGKVGSFATVMSLIVTLFGAGVVQILVCSEMLESLIPVKISFCQWTIIVGFSLLPLSFFGSPVDFPLVAFFAMSSTSIAAVLILISLLTQGVIGSDGVADSRPLSGIGRSLMSVMLGLSSMFYSFSGTSCMPTIQNDMKNKKSFKVAIMCAYTVMIAIYLPISVVGYYKAGDLVQSNIVRNLKPSVLTTIIEVLMTAHVLCAYLILMNPVNLNIETFTGMRHSMNTWRCLSRTLVTLLAIFTAQTVPKFGKLLPIIGASATLIQTFILPSLFYYRLSTSYAHLSRVEVVPLILLTVIGVVGAILGTYSAVSDLLSPNALTLPCYLTASCSACPP